MKTQTKTVSAPNAEGIADQNSQRQKAEIVGLLESYLDVIENVWDAPEPEKQREIQKLKLLLKYELALACPVPVFLSLMETNDKEEASTEETADRRIHVSPVLKAKVAKVAAKLNCSEDEAASTILSEGIGKYLGKSLLGGESDELDI